MKMNNIVACVPVSNIEEAVAWYQAAFELGAPHSMPMEGIVEFNLGRFWLQLFESPETAGAEAITLVLGVDDARAEQQRLADLGFSVTEVETIDEVVDVFNLIDPDGNAYSIVLEAAAD